jgi:hypothetical protein
VLTGALTLLSPDAAGKTCEELHRFGWRVTACGSHGSGETGAVGLLVAGQEDVRRLPRIQPSPSAEPHLLLVYGDQVPCGLAEKLKADFPAPRWEVVRLYLYDDGQRALLGGEASSKWLDRLRRHLAERQVISLVCRIREAEEAVRQLSLYLAWKEQFTFRMARRCDETGVRLQVVARALGMDKRIGQGWMRPQPSDGSLLRGWLAEQCSSLVRKANVHRVALWGRISFWQRMPLDWLSGKEVRMYAAWEGENPNEPPDSWRVSAGWPQTLDEADLLVIGEADADIKELSLSEIVGRMRQPIVIDACSCFPLQEADAHGLIYRTIGENTNIWEWNGL